MCVSMCVGLTFLAGGRGTLATTKMATAALLAAFFPKFPTHTEDNRYHLQAFRHLYVLAVEPRLILPRDLDTGKLCYAHIQVVDLEGAVKEMKAPCIIPELNTLQEVRIADPRYWPVCFHRDRNWDQLQTFLKYTWCIDLQQRAGCLSYSSDPHGFRTLLARCLTLEPLAHAWVPTPDNIELFTNDEHIINLISQHTHKERDVCPDCLPHTRRRRRDLGKGCTCRRYTLDELEYVQGLGTVTYDCLLKDMLQALPMWTAFLKIIRTLKTEPTTQNVWQIKLLLSLIEKQNKNIQNKMKTDEEEETEPLISTEFTIAIKQKVCHIFDSLELKLTPYFRKYLGLPSSRKLVTCDESTLKSLSAYITYHDLERNMLKNSINKDELSILLSRESEGLTTTAESWSKLGELVR